METHTPMFYLSNAQARVADRVRKENGEVAADLLLSKFQKVREQLPVVRLRYRMLATAAAILSLSACSWMRPIAEYGHISHATQHIDGSGNKFGCNYLGAGVRIKGKRLQIDLLESYSFEQCQGPYNETFAGRVNWEF
jgi:hypothetical protein